MNSVTQNGLRREPLFLVIWARLSHWWRRASTHSKARRLRLSESLSLGEKRFVAVIEFESERFLIAGGSAGVNLLARLGEGGNFSEVLTEWCERQQ